MKTYKAISRTSGKELQVELGLVQKSIYVNIADVANVEQKSKNMEIVGKAIVPGYGDVDKDVRVFILDGKLVFKAENREIEINCFVEGAVEIEDFLNEQKAKSQRQEKEYKEFLRQSNL
jgi:hypothetical protein